MTEREKIEKLRQTLTVTVEILRVLGGFELTIQEAELTLGATEPAVPRRTHEERWKQSPEGGQHGDTAEPDRRGKESDRRDR